MFSPPGAFTVSSFVLEIALDGCEDDNSYEKNKFIEPQVISPLKYSR